MTIPLFEKYRPKKFSDVKAQDLAITKLKTFFSAFSRGLSKKNALLLYGPAGIGKTTLAHVLASELDYEIFELNASDLRNRKKLEEVLSPSIQQKSLFAKGKVILVDEVDGVTTADYGGLPELIALIEKTKFPLIITANDVWKQKFSLLRKKTDMIQLKEIPYVAVFDLLREVSIKENKQIGEETLRLIASKSKGDLRAALNDLQSLLDSKGGVTSEQIGEREKTGDIFSALKTLFKTKPNKEILELYENLDLETDQIVLWIEKNIPKEYRGEALYQAFESLSKADLFKGRIYKQQHWRFLVYQNFFLTAGISSASKNKTGYGFTKYEKPTRILKIWMANQKNAKKKSIAVKYAEYCHISKKRAMKEFGFVALILDEKMIKKLDLNDQEKDFLKEFKNTIKNNFNLTKSKA